MQEVPPTPPGVSEELHKRCHAQGVLAGHKAVADMSEGAEMFSALTGGLGAILALTIGEAAQESAYSDAYDECIREGKNEQEQTPKATPQGFSE